MKQPGLDKRHRDEDGKIHRKRGDTLNKNLPQPIPGFGPDIRLDAIRKKTGLDSEKDILDSAKKKR